MAKPGERQEKKTPNYSGMSARGRRRHQEPINTTELGATLSCWTLHSENSLLGFWLCKSASLQVVKGRTTNVGSTAAVTWKWTNLAMLGSAMNIWCSRQQMRHCTSLRSLSRLPSCSAASTFPLTFSTRSSCFDFSAKGPLTLLSRLSVLAPSCCSSEVGRQTSRRIWTAALSWG